MSRHAICPAKYADNLVPQSMIDRMTEIGRCYEMEINVKKTKVMRLSRLLFPLQIMIRS
jgi:hypothetical protein